MQRGFQLGNNGLSEKCCWTIKHLYGKFLCHSLHEMIICSGPRLKCKI